MKNDQEMDTIRHDLNSTSILISFSENLKISFFFLTKSTESTESWISIYGSLEMNELSLSLLVLDKSFQIRNERSE